jgi:hypothetical protein
MARARNIKPGLFKNEVLGVADPLYTLLFEGLWILADRSGRLEDRPMRIKAEVFPYRMVDVDPMLDWLQAEGFIQRYIVAGKRYILIAEFVKHQNPHKNEAESIIPAPEEIGTASEIIGSTRADSLSTDSLIPDSGYLEEGEQVAPAPATPEQAAPKAKKSKAPQPECPEDVDPQVWQDWLELRRKKSAPVTATVIEGAREQAQLADMPLERFLRIWCRRGSQGLEAAWLKPDERRSASSGTPYQQAQRERVAEFAPALAKRVGLPSTTVILEEVPYVPAIASR